MSRIVSVWLPRWPILRFLATQARRPSGKLVDPERPFVLVATAAGGPRIAALNEAAEAAGIMSGESLADARAKTEFLQTRDIDPAADDSALRRLALWATRYTPTASPLCRDFWAEENGADGFFLDIAGASHLFGGEQQLVADLALRLEKIFRLPARLAIADTPGIAWALSRFSRSLSPILPSGQEAEALKPLPVEALRLSGETCRTLRRLGFKSIGTLLEQPRAPFAARFPAELLMRIDQALGRRDEPLIPIVAPPVYHMLRYLIEPILTQEAIVALARRLMQTLTQVLARDDVSARALRLSLYRVDGAVETIEIGLTLPTRDVAHVVRLIDLKLEALAAAEDAGFGFEAVGLAITRVERTAARQNELIADDAGEADRAERCAVLADTLRQRLGPHSVRRFEPVASHIPERAEALVTISSSPAPRGRTNEPPWPEPEQKPRPLLLLPRAEPTDVTALVPDGPPRRFCWRGVTHEVALAQGPERIGAEWWRSSSSPARPRDPPSLAGASYVGFESAEARSAKAEGGDPALDSRLRGNERHPLLTRDYYLVEDADGHRFWLYREGLYERETAAARWFVHGLFA